MPLAVSTLVCQKTRLGPLSTAAPRWPRRLWLGMATPCTWLCRRDPAVVRSTGPPAAMGAPHGPPGRRCPITLRLSVRPRWRCSTAPYTSAISVLAIMRLILSLSATPPPTPGEVPISSQVNQLPTPASSARPWRATPNWPCITSRMILPTGSSRPTPLLHYPTMVGPRIFRFNMATMPLRRPPPVRLR